MLSTGRTDPKKPGPMASRSFIPPTLGNPARPRIPQMSATAANIRRKDLRSKKACVEQGKAHAAPVMDGDEA
ncbi:hypothetical protein Acsp02_48870 [Actinoplanes sp. NBRC 103695]|nr:hypothetical protein Acsp02_48870 [Actinoplanes sp. NBRC 103695]